MDDVRIYNRALSAEEVEQLYAGEPNPVDVAIDDARIYDTALTESEVELLYYNALDVSKAQTAAKFGNRKIRRGLTNVRPRPLP